MCYFSLMVFNKLASTLRANSQPGLLMYKKAAAYLKSLFTAKRTERTCNTSAFQSGGFTLVDPKVGEENFQQSSWACITVYQPQPQCPGLI